VRHHLPRLAAGSPESGQALAHAAAYHHPGHLIVVASGDAGFTAASFPADLSTVTAAGGTQLARAANKRGWSEQAWNSPVGATGSGCSAYVPKPAWQHDPHCAMRTGAKVTPRSVRQNAFSIPNGPWLPAPSPTATTRS
jgi:hypothetical protein